MQVDPDIIIIVFLGMPQNDVQLVWHCCIFDFESKRRLVAGLPLLSGYGYYPFIQVNGSAGMKQNAASQE
jgi:hypothetical protein